MSKQASHFYEFDSFRLDPEERVLFRDGMPVSLSPKLLDTLLVLVRENGHIVEKKSLMAQVWPDTYVEENNLSQYVSTLRRVLGDEPRGSRYIETVPRRGYRFTAAVREIHGGDSGTDGTARVGAGPAAASAGTVPGTIGAPADLGARTNREGSPNPTPGSFGALPGRRAGSIVLSFLVVAAAAAGLALGVFHLSGRSPAGYRAPWPPGLPVAAEFTIRTFDPSVWPREDAEIGVTGFVIEDFEDVNLVDGLEIELSGSPQTFGPSGRLPMAFHPDVDDSGGARVFVPGVWDGSRLFINRSTPPPHGYADYAWADVTFHIPRGASSFGFSLHDMDLNTELSVNGVSLLNLRRLLPSGSTRGGYVRIDAVPGVAIHTVKIARSANNATGDGLGFDHVAFRPLGRGREDAPLVSSTTPRSRPFR